ncbi:MAG TPA: hypothetical protein VF104_03030 [Burkholderiales bacterium]
MADEKNKPQDPSPDALKGPGGLTMRQIYQQVQKAQARDGEAAKMRNTLAQKQGRWQRFVHYMWDKKKG